MKWLKRKLNRWLAETDIGVSRHGGMFSSDSINIYIYKVEQGTVVETRIPSKSHNDVLGLHIVLDGQDLGDSINKIITKELLRAN